MKKIFILTLTLMLALINLEACAYVKIDYGESKIYTMTDIDFASGLIEDKFNSWRGCTLKNIRYAGDDFNNAKNIAWLNELAAAKGEEKNYVQCMKCLSDFYVSKDAAKYDLTFEPDSNYKDWQWWLARAEGEDWELVSWGY